MRRIASLLLSVCMILSLCACGQKADVEVPSNVSSWQEQYDLGVRYLSDGNYEEAIIAFTAAIEIDTKNALAYIGRGDAYLGQGTADEYLSAAFNDFETALSLDDTNADAYLGMAEVYIARKQFDEAMEILRQGVEKTGDQRLTDRLAELEDGNISDYWGRTLKETHYDGNGALTCWLEYDYNDLGQCTDITSYGPDGNQIQHIEQRYDEQGRMIYGHYGTSGNGDMQGATYTYNGADQWEKVVFDSGSSIVYTYDSSGNEIREDFYDASGNLTGHIVNEYGEGYRRENHYYVDEGSERLDQYYVNLYNGDSFRREQHNADGALECYWTYEYDTNGKLIAIYSYDADGNLDGSQTFN